MKKIAIIYQNSPNCSETIFEGCAKYFHLFYDGLMYSQHFLWWHWYIFFPMEIVHELANVNGKIMNTFWSRE